MDINATLIGQMITFTLFVLFTMKFVWPPLMRILAERRKKIAEGLAAAEKAHHDLELAERRIKQMLLEAKSQASLIIDHANQRAHQIEEDARDAARQVTERMKKSAEADIAEEINRARAELQKEASELAILCTERLLHKNLDRAANEALLKNLVNELKQ
jgi:F-type H+-transporting ATPase subunit b